MVYDYRCSEVPNCPRRLAAPTIQILHCSNEPGEPNGVTITARVSDPNCLRALPGKKEEAANRFLSFIYCITFAVTNRVSPMV